MTTSSGILHSYFIDTMTKSDALRPADLLLYNKTQKGGDFLIPLSNYLHILADVDKVMLPYMTKEKLEQLRHELRIAYLLLLSQLEYEFNHQKTENRVFYIKKIQESRALIKKCCMLLDNLNPKYQELIKNQPEQAYFSDGKPISYCGITLGQEFSKQIINFIDHGKTQTIKGVMGALNEKRLYWIWSSVFLKTALSLVPENFFNASQADGIVRSPDPYTGCLSWTLYYFRFSVNLFLLLKHTIKGPWMSQEEASVDWWDRFKTQWAQRKFTLLNDSIWGTANLICFFWLNGKGALGSAGDILTIFLLVFDITISLWDFAEQQTKHRAEIAQYEQDIGKLKVDIARLNSAADDANKKEHQLKILQWQMQLNTLERIKAQSERNWNMQKLSLYNNIAYAVSLTIAFVILTTPFMPIPVAIGLTLGVVGAVLCFAFTVISSAIRSGLEIHKTRHSLLETKAERQQYFDKIKELLNAGSDLDNPEIKLLYLEIMKLDAETEYQKQLLVFQSLHLIRSIIIEALIPAIIFSSLVFLPLGVGLGALAGALGLAIASNFLINWLLKPDEKIKQLPDFDAKHYKEICESVRSNPQSRSKFFDPKRAGQNVLPAKEPENLNEDDSDNESTCTI